MRLISLFSLEDTINHSAGNEFCEMTYAMEPVGDEIVNDGITLMPKCLQSEVPDFKKHSQLPGPKFSHSSEKALQRKTIKLF